MTNTEKATPRQVTNNKVYIGKVEAFEIAQERGFFELPRKGKEVLTVPSIAENIANGRPRSFTYVLGKDESGFYLDERD